MGRRTDHSRDELKELILSAAEEIVAESGSAELTARSIAERIGYSVGTLYNFFEDLGDLVVHVNSRTLDALYKTCVRSARHGGPQEDLRAYARAYIRFTEKHERLWMMLLDRTSPRASELPEWYQSKVQRLLSLIEQTLVPLFHEDRQNERRRAARVLWASLDGISSRANARAIAAEASELADDLITTYVAGLASRP